MHQGVLIDLRCPHCGKLSRRPLSFIAARHLYVCNHSHEMVPIDIAVAAVQHTAAGRESLAGRAR